MAAIAARSPVCTILSYERGTANVEQSASHNNRYRTTAIEPFNAIELTRRLERHRLSTSSQQPQTGRPPLSRSKFGYIPRYADRVSWTSFQPVSTSIRTASMKSDDTGSISDKSTEADGKRKRRSIYAYEFTECYVHDATLVRLTGGGSQSPPESAVKHAAETSRDTNARTPHRRSKRFSLQQLQEFNLDNYQPPIPRRSRPNTTAFDRSDFPIFEDPPPPLPTTNPYQAMGNEDWDPRRSALPQIPERLPLKPSDRHNWAQSSQAGDESPPFLSRFTSKRKHKASSPLVDTFSKRRTFRGTYDNENPVMVQNSENKSNTKRRHKIMAFFRRLAH